MDCSANCEPQKPFRSQLRASDYRSVIATALVARPFDEESLHDCVCTYVRAERDTGRLPSDVIVALTELVEQKGIASATVRHTLVRRVIPWCVEAYFGTRASGSPVDGTDDKPRLNRSRRGGAAITAA